MQLLQSHGENSGHWKREGGFASKAVSQETCHCPDMEVPRVNWFPSNKGMVFGCKDPFLFVPETLSVVHSILRVFCIKKENKMNETKKSNKLKILAGVLIVVVIAAIFAVVYTQFSAKPTEGSKAITIEVIDNEEQTTTYDVKTDAEYLRQAMEESDMEFSGTESEEYGMMVDTINGLTADYDTDGAYWAFYVDGEYCSYGIDSQPVEDGQDYQIIYTTGN
jgi:FlaG/FlaF family flagellin (archaellin)